MPLKILVVGSGGREHALIRRLAAAPSSPVLYAAPGNPGTAGCAENVPLKPAQADALAAFCREQRIDLVIVGPEDPLIDGLADRLRRDGIAVFGPGAAGARLEGDKEYAKEVMAAAGVPTAAHRAFDDHAEAAAYLHGADYPLVVKATGAAQGKGVAVCATPAEALAHLDVCLREKRFGAAGARVLVEECLEGPELSVLAVTDGERHALLAPSRDHKRVGEGDTGPNTGGMGAFAPVQLSAGTAAAIERTVVAPTLAELRRRGIPYRGVLYAGLMLTREGPRVLEFNCRFGDPETQVVLPLLAVDLAALCLATATGRLGPFLEALPAPGPAAPSGWAGAALSDWTRHAAVVVAAAGGYPGSYARGAAIQLPPDAEPDAWTIHAGTRVGEGGLETAGGRVLGVVGTGGSRDEALAHAYRHLDRVRFEGMHYRRDIAGGLQQEG